jgi:hypothetical protein
MDCENVQLQNFSQNWTNSKYMNGMAAIFERENVKFPNFSQNWTSFKNIICDFAEIFCGRHCGAWQPSWIMKM